MMIFINVVMNQKGVVLLKQFFILIIQVEVSFVNVTPHQLYTFMLRNILESQNRNILVTFC